MTKIETYKIQLQSMPDWDEFLLQESALPGPRANLELLQAVSDLGSEDLFLRYIDINPQQAPYGSTLEFLPVCGTAGLGRLLVEGKGDYWLVLRRLAVDPRWRVREAVAMALQRFGRHDMLALLSEMHTWMVGDFLIQRAVVAALCEPVLLSSPAIAREVLQILDDITASIQRAPERKGDDFRVLRQALGYGWSVAAVALPLEGKHSLERWLACPDKDIRWIVRENLKKNRLVRMDPAWVQSMVKGLAVLD